MIADTNFLLRALDQGDSDHGHKARKVLERHRIRGHQISVYAATVIEVAYVLRSVAAGYGYSPAEVSEAVHLILEEPALEVESRESLLLATKLHAEKGIDFHDCYLASIAMTNGEKVFSFDADFRKLGVSAKLSVVNDG